jgi:hypothetical protein
VSTEKSRISKIISDGPIRIIPAPMKNTIETPQAYVNRVMRESGLSHVRVAERAQKLKHKLSAGYVHNLARGVADNPSVKLIKAVAAGLGRPEEEVFLVFRGKQLTNETGYGESTFAVLWNEYRGLSTVDQKELRPMIDMLHREIQRRFKS